MKKAKGYAKGGATKKTKAMAKGGKMPMKKDPETGRMVPAFAMDGRGSRDIKKAKKGGKMTKGYAKGGKTTKGYAKGGKMTKGYAKGGAMKKNMGGAMKPSSAKSTGGVARGTGAATKGKKFTRSA